MKRFALALLLIGHAASAQPADLTKEFQAGVDAFRLGKFDEAREHLEKARDIDPKLPGPYRFLAAVAHGQARWDDCVANAHQALELNPRSAEAADTRKLYEECRQSAGRPGFNGDLAESAAIAVTTNVTGATVKINGLTYGATPISPRPITAGKLEIEISKQGWKPTTLEVNALAGIVTDVSQELEPDPNSDANELQTQNPANPDKGWLVIRRPTGTGARDGSWPPGSMPESLLPPELRGGATTGGAGTPATTTGAAGARAHASSCDVIVADEGPNERRSHRLWIDGKAATGCQWDQKEAGALRYELTPGTHTIEIKVPLSDAWKRRVRISAGQKTVVQPELMEHDARAAIEKRGMYLVGGGGVLLVGGFITAMISRDAAAEARDIVRIETARTPGITGDVTPIRTRDDLNNARDRASRFAIISDVAYGAGLVAAGVGAYYLYKGARERTDVPPPFAIAPTHGGLFVAKEVAW